MVRKREVSFDQTVELPSPKQRVQDTVEVRDLRIMKEKKNKNEFCESTKPPQRNLRTRTVKSYSEIPKAEDFELEETQSNEKSPVIESGKRGIPIYKTMEFVEEKIENKDQVYEFVDDLPESCGKVRKSKKSVRKSAARRARKVTALQRNRSQKVKTKQSKNISKNGQLKEEEKQSVTGPEPTIKHNVYANIKIPEHLLNAGDSTIAEASTILITSDQSLYQSNIISPINADTLQFNAQDCNMSNHFLIRPSMSPITKEVDNLFIGSPRRSMDTFSQVQEVAQSTPQINRFLTKQEKFTPVRINLIEKSIYSEDTIHHSSLANEKLTMQKPAYETSQAQEESVSPRKFGTVISNLNSKEITTTSSTKQASLQDEQHSPVQELLPSTSFENDISPITAALTMKVRQVLFEKLIQSVKRRVSIVSNAENANSLKENRNPNSVAAGSSHSEKPKPVILRQSNLNNFLNLDELPESTHISTVHGVFDDIHSTPRNRKKPRTMFEESNIENEFSFDNCNFSERFSPIKKRSGPFIATARDVARSVKGKIFVKARVKSALTRRMPESLIKKSLLNSTLKKRIPEPQGLVNEITRESNVENEKSFKDIENEMNKSLMNKDLVDAEYEKNNSLTDAENLKNKRADVENEMNENLEDAEYEKNNSFTVVENLKNKRVDVENKMSENLEDAEYEKNNSFTVVENLKNKRVDVENKMSENLEDAEYQTNNNSFTNVENLKNKRVDVENENLMTENLEDAEYQTNNSFTDVQNLKNKRVDVENESLMSENLEDAEYQTNNSFTDVENLKNKRADVEYEMNESLMNKNLEDAEYEKNNSFTDAENFKSKSVDVENEMNESLMSENLEDAEYEKNNSFTDVENLQNKSVGIENETNENESLINKRVMHVENSNKLLDSKEAFLEAMSFSDTFDFLSENREDLSLKVPEELPLFVDMEPLHFSQPPRRSYNKKKKAVCFNTSRVDSESEISEEDDYDIPKKKRKKESKISKEDQKRMQQWVKSVNETFDEIEQYNLTVE